MKTPPLGAVLKIVFMTKQEKFEDYMKKVRENVKDTEVRRKLSDISTDIVLGRLSRRYFGKSVSWFYNKLNGIDGNGGEGGFTHEELQQLKGALCDLADRIRRAADNL